LADKRAASLPSSLWKYANKDATIEIRLEGNKLYFKDNGIGIPSEKLPHIFDKFHTTSRTGTGIGLHSEKWSWKT
jgi:signal transduction histidine kinase